MSRDQLGELRLLHQINEAPLRSKPPGGYLALLLRNRTAHRLDQIGIQSPHHRIGFPFGNRRLRRDGYAPHSDQPDKQHKLLHSQNPSPTLLHD